MLFHDVNDCKNYTYLLRIPTYPQNMYLKIKDIHSCEKEMSGKWCSLLVAVRCVSDLNADIFYLNGSKRIKIECFKTFII